jgi:1,2-phenylacetyl-CoA epoxidase catalytic subunit
VSAVSTDTQEATAAIVSLVGSFADNKAALGRRYGEWAVSAPTIEAAVAAAAMAQDELGHARSTYPVLEKLGESRAEDPLESGTPLPFLADELPDWPAMIAANLVVDGILTTWVASARDSSIEPLAQRARKILQEEGSHRVHAESWARRICRAGGSDRELLLDRIAASWAQASRWLGPSEDAGYAAAVQADMLSQSPSAVREAVRTWVKDLLESEGCSLDLDEPTDWSAWDEKRRY